MKRLPEPVLFGLVQFISSFFAALPGPVALGFGKAAGQLVFYFSSRRRAAYADLKHAFGSQFTERERWRIVRRHYAHLGQMGIEFIRFPSMRRGDVEEKITIHHRERFEKGIQTGRGLILITAHYGNWELLQIISGILGYPLHVLARSQKEKEINELMNRVRESHGSRAITRGMGIRQLFRVLKEGGLIGLLGDQDAGKQGGVILPFFGRKTTIPTGAFEMARRSGAPLLPCFSIRTGKDRYAVEVGQPIDCGQGAYEMEALLPAVRHYLDCLEKMIARHPEQWLWANKRWKYSWTRRIVILSDGKAGHLKQCQAVAEELQKVTSQHGREGMEYFSEVIPVRFRSHLRQKLFSVLSLILLPWIQGRLSWLRWFLEKETVEALRQTCPDIVISGGASVLPVNLSLARECRAKTVVLMKPGFPFSLFRYDLAVVPAHDRGRMPKETIRTVLTPSSVDGRKRKADGGLLAKELNNPAAVRYAFFIGGPTRNFRIREEDIEAAVDALEQAAGAGQGDYLITTSRRTPEPVAERLKSRKPHLTGCQKLVIASEDTRPEIAGGMVELAETLVVTEDSISMISEGLAAAKKVVILILDPDHLPAKHKRFQELLLSRQAVKVCRPAELSTHLNSTAAPAFNLAEEERQQLQQRLASIL